MGRHSKQKGHLIHLNSLQGSAAEQSSDPNTLAHYVQTLMSLSRPDANIYHAISTPDHSISNSLDTFAETTKEFDGWLECAQLIILTLEETVKRDEIPVESIADMDVLIQKFVPNIVLLKDLSVRILDRQKEDGSLKDENMLSTIERIQSEWLEIKQSFTKVKKNMTKPNTEENQISPLLLRVFPLKNLNFLPGMKVKRKFSGLMRS